MSDIYVKGWINGLDDNKQETDIHYRLEKIQSNAVTADSLTLIVVFSENMSAWKAFR